MPNFYVNSCRPLASNTQGLAAIERDGLQPFVDYSIRRQPDLEHDYPSISCICRENNFAPRLRQGDVVSYITTKGKYGTSAGHHRLTAVLKVLLTTSSYKQAAAWYRDRGLTLPSNCLVDGNPPKPVGQSCGRIHGGPKKRKGCGGSNCENWDDIYQERVRANGAFAICEPLLRDLSWDALILSEEALLEALGESEPLTRNPHSRPFSDWLTFQRVLRIPSRPL